MFPRRHTQKPAGEQEPALPDRAWADAIRTLENREPRAARDHLAGDYHLRTGSPDTTCRAGEAIPSSAKVAAWHLVNTENRTVGEHRLFALVDAVACLLSHGGPEGGPETARQALETVVGPRVALAAMRALVGDELAI